MSKARHLFVALGVGLGLTVALCVGCAVTGCVLLIPYFVREAFGALAGMASFAGLVFIALSIIVYRAMARGELRL